MPEELDFSEEELKIAEEACDEVSARILARENANRDQQQNQAKPARPEATG